VTDGDGEPTTGDVVGVRLEFLFGDEQVAVTAHSVNGVELLKPTTALISFEQWIEIGCKLQLKKIAARQAGMTTDTALARTGLIVPGGR
jgi:hypothetical protein